MAWAYAPPKRVDELLARPVVTIAAPLVTVAAWFGPSMQECSQSIADVVHRLSEAAIVHRLSETAIDESIIDHLSAQHARCKS